MEKQITIGFVFLTKILRDGLMSFFTNNCNGKYKCSPVELVDKAALAKELPDYVLVEINQKTDWCKTKSFIQLVLKNRKVKVIVIGDSGSIGFMTECVRIGVWSLFLTEGSMDDLIELIEQSEKGYCKRSLFDMVMNDRSINGKVLTEREREILLLICTEDLGNKQIAKRLHLSLYTVKNHIHNIIEKLGVADRHEAARMMEHRITNDV